MSDPTVDLSAARQLLDFGASIGDGPRADEQLEGAVAIHNILEQQGVAYLADEVGMGKTYVALGAMALFRHFNPEFRVLIIAPRENIQAKWMKELSNFCANNVRFPDLRVKSLRGGPARPMVSCGNLQSLVHEVGVDPRRDFFVRMTSFSMGLTKEKEGWQKPRDQLRAELPWLADDVFDLRSKEAFKDNYARAVCCALPAFDLVIVDEGHNLKHGFREGVAARNRMLAFAMGRDTDPDLRRFPGYGPRAKRVLFLSATPIEESYVQLWNQLDVFRRGREFDDLRKRGVPEGLKQATAARFMVRRVTSMRINGSELTKNQYRREWREGGVLEHDKPIEVTDPKKRLVVALVQKKVAELLGSGKFNMSFQIGMLASFESFLQTAKLRPDEELGNFDDPDQAQGASDVVKEGLDVRDVNRLARSYHKQFNEHLPHPKMDAVVDSLSTAWLTGKKSLVFVRRVASVKELKQKLDERYDKWLISLLRDELPSEVGERFGEFVGRYRQEKADLGAAQLARMSAVSVIDGKAEEDRGGADTFFAWFFRGEGPKDGVSGARVAQRFIQPGSASRTFFERNHVAEVLGVEARQVIASLASATGHPPEELRVLVKERATRFLSARTTKHPVYARFAAAQAAALECLAESGAPHAALARLIFEQVYLGEAKSPHATRSIDVLASLEEETLFTEILKERWQLLRMDLWPEPPKEDLPRWVRETELRAQLLAATARLGHGLIDIYVMTIGRLRSLAPRQFDQDESAGQGTNRIVEYLERLEIQRVTDSSSRRWAAFDELREVAANFSLILDVNVPEARRKPIPEVARLFGTLMGQQQPNGGMFGQVSKKLVQQFRMPGYPFVLVTTDLLQEGEDLHTFCSSIHHYGISWTPSSMEQRTGRIDRVRSQTDRRLSALTGDADGGALLQVHFPHLQDTVEILQVERVLERMNVFLRLMHKGLVTNGKEDKQINIEQTLARGRRPVEVITKRLESAFGIYEGLLRGDALALVVKPALAVSGLARLEALREPLGSLLGIEWSITRSAGQLLGTMQLPSGRIQPFTLILDSFDGRLLLRCVSPVGVVELPELREALRSRKSTNRVRIGVVPERDRGSYNVAVQEDVLLGDSSHDSARVSALLKRIAEEADRLELALLPDDDRPLAHFRDALVLEGGAGA